MTRYKITRYNFIMSSMTRSVAAAVRAEMKRQQVAQRVLAEALNLTQQSVSRRLSGHVPWDVNELATVAGMLDVPLSALLPEDEPQDSAA